MHDKKLILCYGKTPYTPGRYLEDGLRSIGANVETYTDQINFAKVDMSNCAGVLFVESPSRPFVNVKSVDLVQVPKLFWIHHGENRLETNLALTEKYKADLVLMAHSLHLSTNFTVPVRFFPFAMAKDIFNATTRLKDREIDIAMIGSKSSKLYQQRRSAIKKVKGHFQGKFKLSMDKQLFVHNLAKEYGNSKIVFNHAADSIKSLNMRLFEGMGCGALVISDYVPGMEALFNHNEHYIGFKDHKELIRKIDYYLNHLDEAQKIAGAGYKHLLENHTYEHRAIEILKIMDELTK